MNVVVEVEKDDEMLNVVVVEKNDEILNEIVTDFSHDKVIVSDSDVEMMLIVPYEKQESMFPSFPVLNLVFPVLKLRLVSVLQLKKK